jgi:hypothetical protein
MRKLSIVLAAAAIGLAAAPRFATAAPSFSDAFCPRAVPKVVAFGELSAKDDAAKIAAAAKSAADAYRLCASDAQSTLNVAVEPTVNYDKTRAAQFLVVAGRAEVAAGQNQAAIADLREARKIAVDVVEWQPQSQSYRMSSKAAGNSSARNNDRNGSEYKPSAVDIVAAADAALAPLLAPAGASAAPQPAASPKP